MLRDTQEVGGCRLGMLLWCSTQRPAARPTHPWRTRTALVCEAGRHPRGLQWQRLCVGAGYAGYWLLVTMILLLLLVPEPPGFELEHEELHAGEGGHVRLRWE